MYNNIYLVVKSIFIGGAMGVLYGYIFFIHRKNINTFFSAFFISLLRMGILASILFYLLPSNVSNFIIITASFLCFFLITVFKKAS